MPVNTRKATSQGSFSKRSFLRGTAAASIGVLATWRRAEAATKYDLIVVGGGTAGMPAAIFAADRGANVLVVEKAPVLGGTMDRSGGQISGAGTVFQKRAGIIDHPDAHYADNMRISSNTVDPVLTRLFVDNAGRSINWLAENGFEVDENHPVFGDGHEFFTTRRYQWGPERARSIQAVMEPLYRSAEREGKITTLLSTGVVDLIQDSKGFVVGVTTEDDNRKLADYMGKNVLLACGGCAANPRMFADLHNAELTAQVAYPYSQGAGLILGQGAGGYIRGGEKYLGSFGALLSDDSYPANVEGNLIHRPERRPPWEVWVNANGQRFMREDHPSIDYREHALTRQPGQRMWVIADQAMIDKATPFMSRWSKEEQMEAFDSHPMFTKAESLDALAVKAGINSSGLSISTDIYNRNVQEGTNDPFGREHRPVILGKGPFYAVRITSYSLLSFAGLAVDGGLRVIKQDGTPVPNLYAAGEVLGAGATSGNAYTNGSLVTPAVTFGRLLGQRMLNFSA
ncbi:MAG: FAD-dependent oxidoreductase [Rhodospirillaceae bacterium]